MRPLLSDSLRFAVTRGPGSLPACASGWPPRAGLGQGDRFSPWTAFSLYAAMGERPAARLGPSASGRHYSRRKEVSLFSPSFPMEPSTSSNRTPEDLAEELQGTPFLLAEMEAPSWSPTFKKVISRSFLTVTWPTAGPWRAGLPNRLKAPQHLQRARFICGRRT